MTSEREPGRDDWRPWDQVSTPDEVTQEVPQQQHEPAWAALPAPSGQGPAPAATQPSLATQQAPLPKDERRFPA